MTPPRLLPPLPVPGYCRPSEFRHFRFESGVAGPAFNSDPGSPRRNPRPQTAAGELRHHVRLRIDVCSDRRPVRPGHEPFPTSGQAFGRTLGHCDHEDLFICRNSPHIRRPSCTCRPRAPRQTIAQTFPWREAQHRPAGPAGSGQGVLRQCDRCHCRPRRGQGLHRGQQ